MRKYIYLVVIAMFSVFLTACGGSSSSGTNVTPEEARVATLCVQAGRTSATQAIVYNDCAYGVNVLLFGERNVFVSLNRRGQSKTVQAVGVTNYIACRKPYSPRLESPFCVR